MTGRDVVAVGASAGGVPALQKFAGSLDPKLPAPVLIVMHVLPHIESCLPDILSRCGPLPARHPRNGDPIERGTIYVAPPDHHMEVDGSMIRITRGPVELRHRPSINTLFRSVAHAYGSRAIAILLTGADGDGTAGMAVIRSRGGVTIVQDPEEAMFAQMPLSALRAGVVDYSLKLEEMSGVLISLTGSADGRVARAARH